MAQKINIIKVTDLIIPKGYSLTETGITQSLLSSWQTCRRKFLFEINGWFNPSSEVKFAYGSLIHSVLEAIYSNNNPKDIIEKYQFSKEIKAEDQQIFKGYASAILENYLLYYKKDFNEMRFEQVEKSFDVKFKGFRLRGKPDGRFFDKNRNPWHIEHKNYSRIDEDTMELQLSFNLQNLFYILADSLQFNRQLKGVLYNITRKPDVRKFSNPVDIYKHIYGEIKKNPSHYFIRYEIPYTEEDLKQFVCELIYKLDELHSVINSTRNTLEKCYKNECACAPKFTCPFLNACASGSMFGYKQRKIFGELK
jgi:hypothetical protein